MHPTSLENMRRCLEWYLAGPPARVLDLGASDVNGSYRSLMAEGCEYVGADLAPGPGVDVVLEDPYRLPLDDNSFDLVISGQMMEHCGQFWRIFTEVARVMAPGAMAFVIAPSAGPVHRYPVDCYRFHPDAYAALADWSGLRLVHTWTDARGPWKDIVGVFQKGGSMTRRAAPRVPEPLPYLRQERHADPAVETVRGARPYLEVMADLHELLRPRNYLEIGVREGASLSLARCPALAIDPQPSLATRGGNVDLHCCTSDDFFFFHAEQVIGRTRFDLAFIDGMHLAEFALRDFINIEPVMAAHGVIVIDDVFPNHPVQAQRNRQSQVWTGDIWRLGILLQERRPDLRLVWLDAAPTGLLLISGLNPSDRNLSDTYNQLVRNWMSAAEEPVPKPILQRSFARVPNRKTLRYSIGR